MKYPTIGKTTGAVISTVLFALPLCLNYLVANSYPFFRLEALLFIAVFCAALFLLYLSLRAVKAEWAFYGFLLILLLDLTVGAVEIIHPHLRKILPGRSLSASYVLLSAPVFLITYLLRTNLNALGLAVFGTIFLTTVPALPFRDNSLYTTRMQSEIQTVSANKPNIFFIILDEHIGIDGIPLEVAGGPQLKRELMELYQSNGFFVFGKAFSNYESTAASLPSIFNVRFYSDRTELKGLEENRVLKKLQDEGYAISVYQSNYLDFCSGGAIRCRKAFTYMQNSVGYLLDIETTPQQRFLSLFDGMTYSYQSVGLKALRRRLLANPVYAASIAADRVMEELIHDTRIWPHNTVFVVHLLLPHFPYIFDSQCNFRVWDRFAEKSGSTTSTAEYERYFQQIQCSHRKVTKFLQALKESGQYHDATIFVMGDHGKIFVQNGSRSQNADHLQAFSTFLAVKPGVYNREFEPTPAGEKAPMAKVIWQYLKVPAGGISQDVLEKIYVRESDRYIGREMVDFPQ